MKKNHVDTYSYELEWNRFDAAYYKKAIDTVFELGLEFDGVFGVDQLAIGYMNEAIRRHKRVPEDVKIVAYDGTYLTGIVEPRVTAVAQPVEALARESVRLMARLVNGKTYKNKQVLLEVELKKGKTTL